MSDGSIEGNEGQKYGSSLEEAPESLQVARAYGQFYNGLLDTHLTIGSWETKQQQVNQLVAGLPETVVDNSRQGIAVLERELQINHALIEAHKGEEAAYLLRSIMEAEGSQPDKIAEILRQVTSDQAHFLEPTEGIVIIQVEDNLYYALQDNGIMNQGEAAAFTTPSRELPSFLIVRRYAYGETLTDEGVVPSQNRTLRHETHHLISSFLDRGGFLPKPQEVTPAASAAFGHFRDELAGYIIEGRSLLEVYPYEMVYTTDKDIQQRANKVKSLAEACMQFAVLKGIEPSTFLYSVMSATTFDELQTHLLDLIPLDAEIGENTLPVIHHMWSGVNAMKDALQVVLKAKQAQVTPEIMQNFIFRQLEDPQLYNETHYLSQIQQMATNLAEFSEQIAGNHLDVQDLLTQVLVGKIPFPKDVILTVLAMDRRIVDHMPLVKDPGQLLAKVISLWQIPNGDLRAHFSQLVHSTPEMQRIFQDIKKEIIERDKDGIREEYGYVSTDTDGKARIDKDIEERIALLETL